ncbi:tetratricopeptide (TPR) repeat protein [Flavobacterium arsenatis]|uniref:Tetratricopeptide (TPR) repeat protein n=1 Tax=Flavobacterium arsenatis TaxID=1484332 RepID=A0ABU1TQB1_9FLAO|nr:tetratricopeptide (TPR) repeat protein [Flavobacterium arsenatis]
MAYSEVKQRYKNWAEYSNAYILGRFVWGGPQQNDEDLMLVHLTMLEEPESIWNKLPLHPQHVSEYEAQKSKILKKATFFIEHATPVWTLQNKLQKKFSLSKLFSSDKDAEEKGIRDYEKAQQYKLNGDIKKAREYFLLAVQNGRHKAILEIATIDLKDKNYQSATEFYTMALDIPTLKMNGHFGLGLVAFYQNNMSVFQEHADYLHSHYSSVFPLNLYLQEGELLYAQKQYQKAITAYTKTLGFGIEDRFSVLIKLASCYVMLDQRDDAIDVYAQAYYIQPKPKLIEIMVTLLLELKQFEPAKEWIAIARENGWKDLEIDLKERLDDEVQEN